MVVLAILALVAGLVLIRGPQRSAAVEMRQASGLVAGSLRLARSRAIATNRPVPVRFDPRGASMQVGVDPARPMPAGIGLSVAGAAPLILFRPDGSSSGGLVQLSGLGRTAQVGVSWLTGRVAVGEVPGVTDR